MHAHNFVLHNSAIMEEWTAVYEDERRTALASRRRGRLVRFPSLRDFMREKITEPGACKFGAKVFVAADDTSQRSSETVPVERKATSHHSADPDDMSGFDKMHAPENFGVDNPPEICEDLRSDFW
ncbi:hypothetical protein R1sor_007199 [Riccia sorocarpa]|uniref:Uncharacterized protein n=1 Tax=Riccia sorocarpa TaxID=122646 RepID=A0ABD3HQ48_9MARC